MLGKQAVTNAVIALAVVEHQNQFSVSWEQRSKALRSVVIPGRLQRLQESPLVYYDVAHNYDGLRNLLQNLRTFYPEKPLSVLVNLKVDKDISRFRDLFAPDANISILDIPEVEMHTAETWQSVLGKRRSRYLGTGRAAIEEFLRQISETEVGIITGSHYMASTVYEVFNFFLDT